MDSVALLALQVAMVAVQGLISWRKGRNGNGHAQEGADPAELASVRAELRTVGSEVVRIRDHYHSIAAQVGAASMVPGLMSRIEKLGERVARLEGRKHADVE